MTWFICFIAAILAIVYVAWRLASRRQFTQSPDLQTPEEIGSITHPNQARSERDQPIHQSATIQSAAEDGSQVPLSSTALEESGITSEDGGSTCVEHEETPGEALEAFKELQPEEIDGAPINISRELRGAPAEVSSQQSTEADEQVTLDFAGRTGRSEEAEPTEANYGLAADPRTNAIIARNGDRREARVIGETISGNRKQGTSPLDISTEKEQSATVQGGASKERPEPVKRGGAPRGSHDNLGTGITLRPPEGFRPKLEIVCWKRTWEWVVGIELAGETGDEATFQMLQNGTSLSRDESEENRFCISQLTGEIVAERGGQQIARRTISLEENDYLLFKLSGPEKDFGRLVGSPSFGSYVAIVRGAWQRDEAVAGVPPVTPEPVLISGYAAHFFNLPDGGTAHIAFRNPDGRSIVISRNEVRIRFAGNQLKDSTEDKGPLFGGEPPKVNAVDENFWKQVGVMVVGEEGPGQHKWRTQFPPKQGANLQDLPAELSSRAGGWYFLKIYDENDDLMESMDFGFIRALKEIRIHQPPPLPPLGRHRPVRVEFLHEPACTVRPVSKGQLRVNSKPAGTSVTTIPPDQDFDMTHWQIGWQGSHTNVALLVQRIWWNVGDEEDAPPNWVDQILVLSRQDFLPTSKRALWVRLPTRGWINQISVGFRDRVHRRYHVKVAEQTVPIPLRDFGDTIVLENVNLELSFEVGFERSDTRNPATVARIPAESAYPREPMTRAVCKGGIVIYGDCRNCRTIAKEGKAG